MGLFRPNIKKMKNRGDIQGLVRILREHPEHTEWCLEALYALKDLGGAKELTEVLLESEGFPSLKVKMVEVLRDMGYTEGLRKATSLSGEAGIKAVEALGVLGDIEGLLQVLREAVTGEEAREVIFEVIAETIDQQVLVFLISRLLEDLKYGEPEDKLMALLILQNAFLEKRLPKIPSEVLEQTRSILAKIVSEWESTDLRVAFNALCTLIGMEATPEYLQPLIQISSALIDLLGPIIEKVPGQGIGLYLAVHDQTLRALSSFKNNDAAMAALEAIYEERLLAPPKVGDDVFQQMLAYSADKRKLRTLCALAALGHPNFRERMEYLVSRGKAPRVLVDLYGQATYDDLKSKIGD